MILSILENLNSNSSTNAKLSILKENESNDTLKRVYRLAYHPQIQYGIKKFPTLNTDYKDPLSLETVLDFLEFQLAKRKITGNNAITSLKNMVNSLTARDAEVIRRIIIRDLECGASSTIANKVWKNLIPKQPQMLASAYSEQAIAYIEYPAYAQLKADGARCFAEIHGDNVDDVKLFSRAGNEYLGLTSLKSELIKRTKSYRDVYGPAMVDGELVYMSKPSKSGKTSLEFMMGDDDLGDDDKIVDQKSVVLRSETNGIANKSLKGTIGKNEAESMSFQVWDIVPLDVVYDKTLKSDSYDKRFLALSEIFKGSNRVLVIENTIVNDVKEARKIYHQYVEQGLEGIILKNINSIWENKRSKNLVKFKEEIFIDLRIVDIQEHRKDPTKLGAVFLRSDDNKIRVKCGSGFTDTNKVKINNKWVDIPFTELHELNRTKLLLERDNLIGKIAEIKCNGWVSAEGRDGYVSLFLPIFMKFRHDKDDTNTLDDVFPDALDSI